MRGRDCCVRMFFCVRGKALFLKMMKICFADMDRKNRSIEKNGVSLHFQTDIIMKPGKRICSQLKEIRRSIAAENEIPYHERECTYEGPCRGTCPYCEAELRYLGSQLRERLLSGKAATVAGIAVSLASLTACGSAERPDSAGSEADTVTIKAGDVSSLPPDTVATQGLVREPAAEGEKAAVRYELPIAGEDICVGELAVEDCLAGVKDEDYAEGDVGGVDDEIVAIVSEEPEFPGGFDSLMAYLQQHVRYPQEAREQGVSGKVYVTFVVETDGRVSNVRLLRDIGGGCGQEAVRVVKGMPKWKPGRASDGRVVRTPFNLPIAFSLD